MEMYCPECRKVFKNKDYLLCPYCGTSLKSRVGRQPIPRKLRHKVFERDNYRCRECGATNKETTLEIDHIVPVAEGGTNDIDNLQTLCKECNRAKLTDEWVGGQNSIHGLKKELNNLKDKQFKLENLKKDYLSEDEVLDINFKLKITSERISELEKIIKHKEMEVKSKKRKEKEILYKKLYIESNEFLSYLFKLYNVPPSIIGKQKKIKYLINNTNNIDLNKIKKEVEINKNIKERRKYELIDYLNKRTNNPIIIKKITEKINNNKIKYELDIAIEIQKEEKINKK